MPWDRESNEEYDDGYTRDSFERADEDGPEEDLVLYDPDSDCYYNEERDTWGEFAQATRYPADAGGHLMISISAAERIERDRDRPDNDIDPVDDVVLDLVHRVNCLEAAAAQAATTLEAALQLVAWTERRFPDDLGVKSYRGQIETAIASLDDALGLEKT